LELNTGVVQVWQPITGIQLCVVPQSKYSDPGLLITTHDEWTIFKYVMEVLMPFWYWPLRISKRHTVMLHHVITVYHDIFDHIDGVMQHFAKKKTQWKEDLFFAGKLARQKLSEYYTQVTGRTGMLLIPAHILDSFRKLRFFRNWDKGIDINPEHKTFYITQYQEAFLKYVEKEYCAKHRRVLVNKLERLTIRSRVPSTTAPGFCQLSFDSYGLACEDGEYSTPNTVGERILRRSCRIPRLLTAARLYSNLTPEEPKN